MEGDSYSVEPLMETLPFEIEPEIDDLEDLEVETINANAPQTSALTNCKGLSPKIIRSCTQELAHFLMNSVDNVEALEVSDFGQRNLVAWIDLLDSKVVISVISNICKIRLTFLIF